MTQQRYRDLAEWPLMGTALVFLAAYAWQVIGRVEGGAAGWLEAVMWATWGIFALDYAVNLWLARDRCEFRMRRCILRTSILEITAPNRPMLSTSSL